MADSDLQQDNSSPVFPATADVNTNADPFLVATDGPVITATSNAPGEAPVNRSIRRAHALLTGLRGAIIGDFAGAAKKTVQGWRVAILGGVTHSAAPGTLQVEGPAGMTGIAIDVENGDVRISGNIECSYGRVTALNQSFVAGDVTVPSYSHLVRGVLKFLGTVISTSNPSGTVALPNELRALNIPKAFASFGASGAFGATTCAIYESAGITSIVRDAIRFTITLATPFDSNEYCVVLSGTAMDNRFAYAMTKNAGVCQVGVFDTAGPLPPSSVTGAYRIDILFFGRQTT